MSIINTVDVVGSSEESDWEEPDSIASRLRYFNCPQRLCRAVESGDATVVETFLKGHGVDIIADDMNYALYKAVGLGHIDVVRVLVAYGADISARDEQDVTLLHDALEDGKVEIAKVLIAEGADINAKDYRNRTPLYCVATKDCVEIAELLIACGADINARGVCGWTALHRAAWDGNVEMVKVLIERGANLEVRCSCNETPLALAIRTNCEHFFTPREKAIALLVERGALLQNGNTDNTGNLDILYPLFFDRLYEIRKDRLQAIKKHYDDLLGVDFPKDLKGLLLEFHGANRLEKVALGM